MHDYWKAIAAQAEAESLYYFPDSSADMCAFERVCALLKAGAPKSAFDRADVAAWRRVMDRAAGKVRLGPHIVETR
jgi:hypothetical protein